MKSALSFTLGALSLGLALGQQDESRMASLKAMKIATRQRMQAEGAFEANKYKSYQGVTPCVDGKAGEYSCDNVDLHGFLTHGDMGSNTREGNDIWGRLSILITCNAIDLLFTNILNRMDVSQWSRIRRCRTD